MLFAEEAGEKLLASVQVKETWARDFFCPSCKKEVHYVEPHERSSGDESTFVSSHFRHNPGDRDECDYPDDVERRPESDTHARMVAIGLERLKSYCENGQNDITSKFPAYSHTDLDTGIQTGGSRTKKIGGHHPDAYIAFSEPDTVFGAGVVLEAQYKNHKKDVRSITYDYQEAGFSVVWTRPPDYSGKYGMKLPEILPATMDYPFRNEYILDEASGELYPGTEIDNIVDELPGEFSLSLLSDEPIDGNAKLCSRWDWSRYDRIHSSTPGFVVNPPTSRSSQTKSKWESTRWPVQANSISEDEDCEGCGRKGTFHVTSKSGDFSYDIRLCKVCVDRIVDMVKDIKERNSQDRATVRRGLEYVPQVARREIDDLPDDPVIMYYAQYRGKVGEEIPRPPPVRRNR